MSFLKMILFFFIINHLTSNDTYSGGCVDIYQKAVDCELLRAVYKGDIGSTKFYLAFPMSADVNACDDVGNTPLIIAVAKGYTSIATLLLNDFNKELEGDNLKDEIVVNVKHKNEEGNTALHYAVKAGQREIVQLLLQKDLTLLDIQNNNNWTPLAYIIEFFGYSPEHKECFDTLILSGISIGKKINMDCR